MFVGTVGEEELGDLRGVKALFRDDPRIDGFISVDGVQVWRVVHAATASILPLMQQAADEENRRWEAKPEQRIKVELKLVGDRPAGAQAYESPVVDTARAALGTLGLEAKSIAASSTDSNLPISLGIPAATLGGGGQGSGSHSPGEWVSAGQCVGGAAEAAADRSRISRRPRFERAVAPGARGALILRTAKKSPRV